MAPLLHFKIIVEFFMHINFLLRLGNPQIKFASHFAYITK